MVARTMSPLSSPAIGFPLSREGVRASHHPRCSRGSFFVPIPWLFRSPYADFVPMPQQVGGILIDSVRPGPFQFILAIADTSSWEWFLAGVLGLRNSDSI